MPPVRVIGRWAIAEQVHAALRAAGVEARLETGAAATVAGAAVESGTVDVVCAEGGSDAACVLIKRADPRRPVLGIAEQAKARDLERTRDRMFSPDAWVVWPATADELVAGMVRAAKLAARGPYLARLSQGMLLGAILGWLVGAVAGRLRPGSIVAGAIAPGATLLFGAGGLVNVSRQSRRTSAFYALAVAVGLVGVGLALFW